MRASRLAMMRILMMLLVFFALPAWAASVSMSVAVPKIEAGQSTRMLVSVVGEQPRSIPVVHAPDGVRVSFVERHPSQRVTPNGIMYTYQFAYRLTGLLEGQWEVGPVEVALGPDPKTGEATTLTAAPVRLTVLATGAIARPDQPIQVTSVFQRENVWEGEVVIYEAELTTQLPILDVEWGTPDFGGLQVPGSARAEVTKHQIQDPAGDITVSRLLVPLIAAGTGDRGQGPAIARVRVLSGQGPFGRRSRTRTAAGTRAPLKVRPLPPPPPDFSGLVGEFDLKVELQKRHHIAVGESVPLKVLVVGNGVADGVAQPKLEAEGIRVYSSDSRTIGRMVNGRFYGEKEFKLTLVPGRVGTLELPDLELIVFSPKEDKYVTRTVALGSIDVVGEDENAEIQSFSPDGGVFPEGEGVQQVVLRDVYTWGPAYTPPLAPLMPFLLGLVALPGLMTLLADGAGGVRGWLESRKAAKDEAFRGKARLRNPPTDPEALLMVCDLALRETLADKIGVPVGSMRREDALASLPEGLASKVSRALAGLDRARFAGGAVPDDVVDRIRAAIKAVESV